MFAEMFWSISRQATLLAVLHMMGKAAFASEVTRGQATWHIFGEKTACPGSFGTTNVVALHTSLFSSAESQCGMCTRVTGKKGSVVVMLVDECVGSTCKELDISKDAFARIADIDEGITPISFTAFAPCDQMRKGVSANFSTSGGEIETAELETLPNADDSISLEVQMTSASPSAEPQPTVADTAANPSAASPSVASPSPTVLNELRNGQTVPPPTSAAGKFGLPTRAIFGSFAAVLTVQLVEKVIN